jgi:hypothetical protein
MSTIQPSAPKVVAPEFEEPDAYASDDALDPVTEALALVTRINERVRTSAETRTPLSVPRVA